MSWDRKPLSEVADFHLGKMLDKRKNKGSSLPYLANKNVRWGSFDFAELREMRFEEREIERFSLRNGDIVMCEGGEPGRCAIWRDQIPMMMYQKALHRIRPHAGTDGVFLYYNLAYRGRSGHFDGLFTGSTIKHLPKEKLALVEVDTPDLPTQERIAGVLSAYDDLIENNGRRIALLEQAARLLYREWFVHFRFPGFETAKFIDGLPEGWEKKKLFDVADPLYGYAFKSKNFSEEAIGTPVVRIRDVPSGISVTYTQEMAPEEKRLKDGDFLIGMDGDFHMNLWIGGSAWLNQRVVRISPKEGSPLSTAFLRHTVRKPIEDLNKTIVGSTVAHLGAKHLKEIVTFVPTSDVADKANAALSKIDAQIVTIGKFNQKLAEARDLLLPRLMDGRLNIS